MVESLGEAALRLRYFVLAADKAAIEATHPRRGKPEPDRRTHKEPILRVYEECLDTLSDHERAALGHVLTKMLGAL